MININIHTRLQAARLTRTMVVTGSDQHNAYVALCTQRVEPSIAVTHTQFHGLMQAPDMHLNVHYILT